MVHIPYSIAIVRYDLCSTKNNKRKANSALIHNIPVFLALKFLWKFVNDLSIKILTPNTAEFIKLKAIKSSKLSPCSVICDASYFRPVRWVMIKHEFVSLLDLVYLHLCPRFFFPL